MQNKTENCTYAMGLATVSLILVHDQLLKLTGRLMVILNLALKLGSS